jgi:hypothetical protein
MPIRLFIAPLSYPNNVLVTCDRFESWIGRSLVYIWRMHIYKAQESCLFVNNLHYTVLANYFITCQNWIEFNTFFKF